LRFGETSVAGTSNARNVRDRSNISEEQTLPNYGIRARLKPVGASFPTLSHPIPVEINCILTRGWCPHRPHVYTLPPMSFAPSRFNNSTIPRLFSLGGTAHLVPPATSPRGPTPSLAQLGPSASLRWARTSRESDCVVGKICARFQSAPPGSAQRNPRTL